MRECKEKAQNIDVQHPECLGWAVRVGMSGCTARGRTVVPGVSNAVPTGRASLGLQWG